MEGYGLSNPGAVDELGRLPSLVYNLRTRSWGSLDAELRQGTVWKPPPPITKHALEAVAIKGRGSHEREAWETCPQLLLSAHAWQITRSVDFSAIENMVVVLVVRQCCRPSAFAQSHGLLHRSTCAQTLTTPCGAALPGALHRHGENAVRMVCGGQHSCDLHAPQRRGRV